MLINEQNHFKTPFVYNDSFKLLEILNNYPSIVFLTMFLVFLLSFQDIKVVAIEVLKVYRGVGAVS